MRARVNAQCRQLLGGDAAVARNNHVVALVGACGAHADEHTLVSADHRSNSCPSARQAGRPPGASRGRTGGVSLPSPA